MRSNYSKNEFWEERYQKAEAHYDWLQRYYPSCNERPLRDLILENVSGDDRVLIVGCGVSNMTRDMFEDGYENITSIDRSFWAIKVQNELNQYPNDLKYTQMDVRDMSFKDGSFDVVIDKALLDCIICGPEPQKVSEAMLSEINRVLTPTGSFLCVSHGDEASRKKYIKNVKKFRWKYKKHMI